LLAVSDLKASLAVCWNTSLRCAVWNVVAVCYSLDAVNCALIVGCVTLMYRRALISPASRSSSLCPSHAIVSRKNSASCKLSTTGMCIRMIRIRSTYNISLDRPRPIG